MDKEEKEYLRQRLLIAEKLLKAKLEEVEMMGTALDRARAMHGKEIQKSALDDIAEYLLRQTGELPPLPAKHWRASKDTQKNIPVAAGLVNNEKRPTVQELVEHVEAASLQQGLTAAFIKQQLKAILFIERAILMFKTGDETANSETPEHKEPKGKQRAATKITYLGYALYHYFWAKHSKDERVAITKVTARRLSGKYGISETQLLKYAVTVEEREASPEPENRNSIVTYAKQYELILPLLKNVCEPAFTEVQNRLKRLKNKYTRFFS